MIRFFKMNSMDYCFIFFDENNANYSLLKSVNRIKLVCDNKHGLGADGAVFVMPPEDKENNSCKMIFYNADGEEVEANAETLSCVAHLYLSQRGEKNSVSIETKTKVYRVVQTDNSKNYFKYETEFFNDDINKPDEAEVIQLRSFEDKIYALCSVQEIGYGYLSGVFISKLKELN